MTMQPYEAPSQVAIIKDYQNRAVSRLAEWAQSADAAFGVAERLVQSSFVPAAFKGKPIEAAAAILAGSEVGLLPMAALRSFDIIGGTAAPRAITLRAIVQSYGHEIVLVESNATRCRMKGRRRGQTDWENITWTLDRARDLGLLGKDQWRKQPQTMLLARATGEIARLIGADAILGIAYSSEEIADDGGAPTPVEDNSPEPAASNGSRRMSRPKKAAPAEPEPEPEIQDDPTPPPVTEPREPNRRGRMFALFGERPDLTERTDRLGYCARVLDREIETSNDLDDADIERVIESLEADDLAAKDLAAWGGQA